MTLMSRAPTAIGEWECTECGYIVEGTAARRPPLCPECNAPSDALEFFASEDEVDEEWDDETEDDVDEDDDFAEDEDYDDDLDEDHEFDDDY